MVGAGEKTWGRDQDFTALGISRIYLSRYDATKNLVEIWGNNLPAVGAAF